MNDIDRFNISLRPCWRPEVSIDEVLCCDYLPETIDNVELGCGMEVALDGFDVVDMHHQPVVCKGPQDPPPPPISDEADIAAGRWEHRGPVLKSHPQRQIAAMQQRMRQEDDEWDAIPKPRVRGPQAAEDGPPASQRRPAKQRSRAMTIRGETFTINPGQQLIYQTEIDEWHLINMDGSYRAVGNKDVSLWSLLND